MNRWFHPEFETDLIAAARFYETQRPHLGAEFLDQAESAIEVIMSAPLRWPPRIGGVRRFILPRIPYQSAIASAPKPCSFSAFSTARGTLRQQTIVEPLAVVSRTNGAWSQDKELN